MKLGSLGRIQHTRAMLGPLCSIDPLLQASHFRGVGGDMGGVGIHSPKVHLSHILKGLWVRPWGGKGLDEVGRVGVPIRVLFLM